jgi:hypothetical protein
MTLELDWQAIPDEEFERYQKRLEIVEIMLDDSIDSLTKRERRREYCRRHSVSDRTLRLYRAKYLKKGPAGLLFYRQRETSPRIHDEDLRNKIIQLVNELPTRTVPKLRELLSQDEKLKEKIAEVSDRSFYRFLIENGMSQKERYRILSETGRRAYHQFEAPFSLSLVQGDARDGIWLDLPEGDSKKTYLFLWVDDFSRKILFGRYYLNENLPCMVDSFRYMILRYGIPERCYLDNGAVYISKQFAYVLADLLIKQIHHRPYQAYCKGKIEATMKIIKHDFQSEAALAGFKTLEELNTAFWAWVDVRYNQRVNSTTGQAPDERFIKALPENHRRIEDIEKFNAMFLWRKYRKITKYGKVKLFSNQYPVQKLPHGKVVQVRFDPFDLDQIYIYDQQNNFLESSRPSKKVNNRATQVPEESKKDRSKVSQDSVNYFTRLREKHLQQQKRDHKMKFTKLFEKKEEQNG